MFAIWGSPFWKSLKSFFFNSSQYWMTPTVLSVIQGMVAVIMIIVVGEVISSGDCVGNISMSEFQGLNALYHSTQGVNWTWNPTLPPTTHWYFSTSTPTPSSELYSPCEALWQGLNCTFSIVPYTSNSDGFCSIQNISLAGMNLVGSLPSTLGHFSNVQVCNQNTL